MHDNDKTDVYERIHFAIRFSFIIHSLCSTAFSFSILWEMSKNMTAAVVVTLYKRSRDLDHTTLKAVFT